MLCYNVVLAILVVSFGPPLECHPSNQTNEIKMDEKATECGKSFELRIGPDKDLKMAAEFAAHIAFQQLKLERKDVLVEVIGGWLMDCQYPKYRILANFMPSNCTRNETRSYGPDECVPMPGAPIRFCKIYMFVRKYGSSRLVSYKCREVPGPNWKPREFPEEDLDTKLQRSRDYFDNLYHRERVNAVLQAYDSFEDHPNLSASSGISLWFLLFCALLPVAGLAVLYRIW